MSDNKKKKDDGKVEIVGVKHAKKKLVEGKTYRVTPEIAENLIEKKFAKKA